MRYDKNGGFSVFVCEEGDLHGGYMQPPMEGGLHLDCTPPLAFRDIWQKSIC